MKDKLSHKHSNHHESPASSQLDPPLTTAQSALVSYFPHQRLALVSATR